MKNFKSRLKDKMIIVGVWVLLLAIVGGCSVLKYKLWRVEHPQAKTWTFFIPRHK